MVWKKNLPRTTNFSSILKQFKIFNFWRKIRFSKIGLRQPPALPGVHRGFLRIHPGKWQNILISAQTPCTLFYRLKLIVYGNDDHIWYKKAKNSGGKFMIFPDITRTVPYDYIQIFIQVTGEIYVGYRRKLWFLPPPPIFLRLYINYGCNQEL